MQQTITATRAGADIYLRLLMFEAFACSMAIMTFVALAGPVARTLLLAPWHIGVAMAVGGLTWIASARWWGALSDKWGRRPVMLSGLLGFALSYLALCLFIDIALDARIATWVAFAGLVFGRGLVGLFYAAIPSTAAALVADNVSPARRAGAMAALGAASGVGMVLGPGLVGLLSPLGLSAPLYATAVLPVLALLVLWRVLPRTEHRAPTQAQPPRLSDPRLRRPMIVAFIAAFSVSVAQITVGFYALDRLKLDAVAAAQAAGIALTVVGVALVISQSMLKQLEWSPTKLIQIGAAVAALGFGATALTSTPWGLWLCFGVAAAGMGWVYPSVSALAANSVEDHEQGIAAGTITAMQGLGIVVGPAMGSLAYSASAVAPYVMVAVLLLVTSVWPVDTKSS